MAAITNGIALDGTFLPYAGTFLVFSDYMRPSLRLAALMRARSTFVFTHDSIFVGEDGEGGGQAVFRGIAGRRRFAFWGDGTGGVSGVFAIGEDLGWACHGDCCLSYLQCERLHQISRARIEAIFNWLLDLPCGRMSEPAPGKSPATGLVRGFRECSTRERMGQSV